MDVLRARLFGQGLTDVHVVQLLAVRIIQIRVSLRLVDSRRLFQFLQTRLRREDRERLRERELVEVARRDDPGLVVLGEDGLDELLQMKD